MAYVLKSNKTVNNPDIDFGFNTPLGVATKSLFDYYTKMSEIGYNLTQVQFDSLKKYENDLKDIGAWQSIKEIAPLIGNTIDQLCVKYKFQNAQIMGKNNGINNSFVDSKGLFIETRLASNPKNLDIKYTTKDSINNGGAGIITMFKRTGDHSGGSNYQNIIGCVGGIDEAFSDATSIRGKYINSTFAGSSIGDGGYLYVSKYVVFGNKITNRRMFKDGEIFSFSNTDVDIVNPVNENLSHFIGGLNNTSNSIYGFQGHISFLAIHNGGFSDTAVKNISDSTILLLASLGKNY